MQFLHRKIVLSISCVLFCFSAAIAQQQKFDLKVFQINIWHEGTQIPNGLQVIAEEIIDKDPDIVLFSEIKHRTDSGFIRQIIQVLKANGATYYGKGNNEDLDVGLISKYPLKFPDVEQEKNELPAVSKTKISIKGRDFIFYSAHLDYTNYACYLPRGYDGVTWKKLPAPIINNEEVLTANKLSQRDEAIAAVISDVEKESKNQLIILAGDFNEPSHLDWTEATKDLFDHRGTVIPWHCSVVLYDAGFLDAFRVRFPNPVTHPGFTFPSYNKDVDINKLTWAPDADERDRIDYIYYLQNPSIQVKDVHVVGPVETVVRAKKQDRDSQDQFLVPKAVWPTDHKALLATFEIN
ncbi:endonuclease/exonuclease/phosphatase family protein [Sphingobacterium hungaricum]